MLFNNTLVPVPLLAAVTCSYRFSKFQFKKLHIFMIEKQTMCLLQLLPQ